MALESLIGKVAVVTGAAGGLGAAVAARLVAEGASVVLADVDTHGLTRVQRELGDSTVAIQADVSSEEGVDAYVAAAVENFGRLDLAHLNAGFIPKLVPVIEADMAGVDRAIAVNLRGAYLGVQRTVRQMLLQGGGGAIVATSSTSGIRGGAGFASYTASKHGVIGVVKSSALEYAPDGIRINAVCPGFMDTQMMTVNEDFVNPDEHSAARRGFEAAIPIGRYAQPSEVAAAVVWLLSDEASYVTGAVLSVDGGVVTGPASRVTHTV